MKLLGVTIAIARNTFTELVRQKVFYFLMIFALLVIGNSAFMAKFSFQEQFQMLKDISLGSIEHVARNAAFGFGHGGQSCDR